MMMNQGSAKKQLLLLDDEPNVLKSLVRLLAQDGYEIHTFSRPIDAIELLKCREIGVIIADQCMPQMEGTEFLQRVSKICPDTVSILLSGYDAPRAQQPADDGNAPYRYLEKPWDENVLRETVTQAFNSYEKRR